MKATHSEPLDVGRQQGCTPRGRASGDCAQTRPLGHPPPHPTSPPPPSTPQGYLQPARDDGGSSSIVAENKIDR